jgi:hypothetical protein
MGIPSVSQSINQFIQFINSGNSCDLASQNEYQTKPLIWPATGSPEAGKHPQDAAKRLELAV